MKMDAPDCIAPPSPELYDKIVKSRQKLLGGEALPAKETEEFLDIETFARLTNRTKKSRAHTLVAPEKMFRAVTGTRKALVLLVDFSDKAATSSQAHFNSMLFSIGTFSSGSMRDYYKEASYGTLDVDGLVSGTGGPTSGWYRAPQPKSYYTDGNFGFNAYPKNAQRLVEDVVNLAAPHVNFAQFDNDGDKVVEALIVIAAGNGAEATGNKNDIWSHKWSLRSPITLNGVRIQDYFMAPEDGRVGVMAHELGHLLMRWPDLYDTDYTSSGTGSWDLMAGGSWNNGGITPAHPTCWCKYKAGWINPVTILNAKQSVTILPYSKNSQAYKLPVGSSGSKEYFLITNRKKSNFDAHLSGEGMIIEHVDENQSNNTDETHYLVDIEQCDGKLDLNKGVNRGDAGDPFPSSSNDSFTATTSPNSKAYDGSDSKISVTEIKRSGDNITAVLASGDAMEWVYDVVPTMTFASHHTSNAWVLLQGIGWRKIMAGNPDGVTNMFVAFCEAVANARKVNVNIDAQHVYIMYLV
jgi:immune inhibitor A